MPAGLAGPGRTRRAASVSGLVGATRLAFPCALGLFIWPSDSVVAEVNSLVRGRRAAQKEKAPIRTRGLKSSVEDRTQKGFQPLAL